MSRPRWILDLHPDFPASAEVAARLPDPIVVTRGSYGQFAWPTVDGPVVLYGTMRMVTQALRQPRLRDAVLDDYGVLRCSSYYRAVYDLLGRTALLVPLTALPHIPWSRLLGPRVFVRPDSNFKLFAARVVDAGSIVDLVADERVHADELVVVSELVNLGPEYRCVCRRGRVVVHSSYPDLPYRPAPPEVIAFAEQAAARLAALVPSPMITVDVAVGDRLRLVEVGGVNSWGLYGADPDAFIAAMEDEATLRFEELTGP
jgi:hypothetical protein